MSIRNTIYPEHYLIGQIDMILHGQDKPVRKIRDIQQCMNEYDLEIRRRYAEKPFSNEGADELIGRSPEKMRRNG